jgi:hypothetical protein
MKTKEKEVFLTLHGWQKAKLSLTGKIMWSFPGKTFWYFTTREAFKIQTSN